MKKRTPIAWIWRRTRRRKGALLIMTGTHILSAFLGVLFALGTVSSSLMPALLKVR